MASRRNPAGRGVTIYLAAGVVEGVLVSVEPLVSGVECEGELVEGVELAGEVMGD